jgi:hypothetical protein
MAVQHMSHLKNALLGLALIGAVIGLFSLFQIFGDDADVAEAKAAVVKRLKDPDSARFSDLVKTGGGYIVCGKVNAKNGFGGCLPRAPQLGGSTPEGPSSRCRRHQLAGS